MRARYGGSFVNLNSYSYSASVNAREISFYTVLDCMITHLWVTHALTSMAVWLNRHWSSGKYSLVQNQIWYMYFGSLSLATKYQLWCLLYDICNVFKNMFNVALIMMWQSTVLWLWDFLQLRHELWKFRGLPNLVAFQKINLQGRTKSIVLSMSANEFTEVPHTTGCKIPQGMVC